MDLTMPMRCPKGHLSTDADYCSECGAKMPDALSGLGAASAAGASALSMGGTSGTGAGANSDLVCPDCGTPRANATAVFCEVCRYNFVTHTSWATPHVSSMPAASTVTPSSAPSSAPLNVPAPAPAAPPVSPDTVPSTAPAVVQTDAPAVTQANAPAPDPIENQKSKIENPFVRWEAIVRVDPSLYTDPDPQMPCPAGEPERVYPLDFADNLIGRRSEKRDIHPEINLNDGCVSHRHAKIQRQPDGTFALLDVGSTNGTHLNGVEIQPAVRTPLRDGDEITLGCWTRITIRGLRG